MSTSTSAKFVLRVRFATEAAAGFVSYPTTTTRAEDVCVNTPSSANTSAPCPIAGSSTRIVSRCRMSRALLANWTERYSAMSCGVYVAPLAFPSLTPANRPLVGRRAFRANSGTAKSQATGSFAVAPPRFVRGAADSSTLNLQFRPSVCAG